MGDRDQKQKKARGALVKYRKIVKDKQDAISKLEDYKEKIQEWNDLIQDIRDLLKDLGVDFDPEIERKLDEISDIIGKLDSPTDQAFDILLQELEKGISEISSSDVPSKMYSKNNNSNTNYPTTGMSAGKKIGIIVIIIAVFAVGSALLISGGSPRNIDVVIVPPDSEPSSQPNLPVLRPVEEIDPSDPPVLAPNPAPIPPIP